MIKTCLVIGLAIWLYADTVLADVQPSCPKPIRFALYENGNLFSSEKNQGIDKDFAEELSKRSHCAFDIVLMPRARIWLELQSGSLMMTGSGIQNPERSIFAWDIRYLALKNLVVTPSTTNVSSLKAFEANPALYWTVVRSYKHGAQADAFLQKLRQAERVREEPDVESIFRSLSLHHADAVMANETAVSAYLDKFNLRQKVKVQDWFVEDPPIAHSLMLSKQNFSDAEIVKWRSIVRSIRSDGTLKKIFEKNVGPKQAQRLLNFTPNDE